MQKNKPNTFKSAETPKALIALSEALGNRVLKVGLYNTLGKPVFETEYPGDIIQKLDEKHYTLKFTSEMTSKFEGMLTMRFAIYTTNKDFVMAGDTCLPLKFEYDPVIANLKK